MLTNVDCVSFFVENLDEGIELYEKKLGLKRLWRTQDSCGLGLSNDITEVVLVTRRIPQVQFKVESVEAELPGMIQAGFTVQSGPFDIDIGKCVVLCDPWGNTFCMLDLTKGTYDVDTMGNVTGVTIKETEA